MIAWSPVRAFASKSSRPSLIASQRLFASSVTPDSKQQPIPMTLLSGFLGSGKTTTLKHLLENTEGVKIGVIVNDVASVNIDAKLVSATNQGIVELQNGCACCSLADELLTSVETLLQKKQGLDALVVELSGVADPVAIKSNWQTAKLQRTSRYVRNRRDKGSDCSGCMYIRNGLHDVGCSWRTRWMDRRRRRLCRNEKSA